MNENRALFCAFYGFFTRKRGGLRRAAFFYSLRIHYAGGKRRSEVPEKQGRDGYEMFGNVEKQRRNKEKAPIFRLVLRGGDEGDRTPYLLNAIQALSQVSYTPMAEEADSIAATLAAARIIIAKRRGDVNKNFLKNQN